MAVTLIFIFPQGIWAIKNGTVCWMDNLYNMSLILSPFSINFKFNFVIWHTWTSLNVIFCHGVTTPNQLASLSRSVSWGGTSVTQWHKFHTDDVKSVRNQVISADWLSEQLYCSTHCLRIMDKRQNKIYTMNLY